VRPTMSWCRELAGLARPRHVLPLST
jgi:hypothetical protein